MMLLTIIIPCYNSARFIAHTLDMLISQGLQDCEVIVVNDGSVDETASIVSKYTEQNSSICLIDKKNEGVSVARNTGMNAARGKFIYFLDSDDMLTDGTLDFFRKQLSENLENNFFAFGYNSQYQGRILKDYSVKKYDNKTLDALQLKQSFFSKKLCFHICSCIYEKFFLEEHNITFTPGIRIGEDVEFLLKVLKFAPNCVYNARHCFIYQIRDDSTMQGYKTFSKTHFRSYEVRRDMCYVPEFQEKHIYRYTNFWLLNQLIVHLIMYLKSNFKDEDITDKFVQELKILKLPITNEVAKKNLYVIYFAKLLPIHLILKVAK